MKVPNPGEIKRARIEIIPLIDVVFFLLATFVLYTLSLNKIQGIPVNLPQASTSHKNENHDTVTITVTDAGGLYWNKESVSFDQFLIKLTNYKRENPDPKILINGDTKAFFGQAVVVLDEVRKAGISKVSIQTKTKPNTSS